jgi:hypothetical protein
MPDNTLPNSVRYVKNGAGGQWWRVAKTNGQIHLGWPRIPDDLLHAADLAQIEALIRKEFGAKRGATQDFNALRTLLDHPSQHVWSRSRTAACGGAPYTMGSKLTLTGRPANGAGDISGSPAPQRGPITRWVDSGIL